MAMTVRELVATLSLAKDQASFDAGASALTNIRNIAVGIGTAVAAAFAVHKVADFVDETRELGAHLDDVNRATGVSTQTLQEFGYAATLGGASVEGANEALTHLGRHVGDALSGGAEAAKVFSSLGISIKDASGKALPLDAVLLQVSDKMKAAKSDAERLNMSFDFFGRGGGAAMVGVLKDGSGALRESMQEARTLGIVLDSETIKATADLDDNMDKLDASAQGLKTTIGSALVPVVLEITNAMVKWWKANGPLIRQGLKEVFEGIGTALHIVSAAAQVLVEHWRSVAIAGGLVLGVLTLYEAGVGAAAFASTVFAGGLVGVAAGLATAAAAAWAFLAPLLAVVAVAVVGALAFIVLDDAVTGLMGGDSVIGSNHGKWGEMAKALDDEATKANISWWKYALAELGVLLLHNMDWADRFGTSVSDLASDFADAMEEMTFGEFIERQAARGLVAMQGFVKSVADLLGGVSSRLGLSMSSSGSDARSSWDTLSSGLLGFTPSTVGDLVGPLRDADFLAGSGPMRENTFANGPQLLGGDASQQWVTIAPAVTVNVEARGSDLNGHDVASQTARAVSMVLGDHALYLQQAGVPGG